MYRYDFSVQELETLSAIVAACTRGLREGYVFFNNTECYKNGLQFIAMVHRRFFKRTKRNLGENDEPCKTKTGRTL